MENLVKLAVGQPYARVFNHNEEGAIAELLRSNSNTLIIAIPDLDHHEVKALKKGKLTCGFLYKNGAILFIWQFCDAKGRPVLTLDSPFDCRTVPDLALHDITTTESRLAVDIHVIDTAKNQVKALRSMTMPPELTLEFMSAVQDQLASSKNGEMQWQEWIQLDPTALFSQVKKYQMGT
ncbi:hypothetical protein [uncultured Shewanella sp.]|uniref:hypothetical protein n=1 Tax=uncultured Shewanella sp. TaxID=173975 RepID=UPI002620430C|nr:hypothetical protein [uncultured Shewanella sp.]